MGYTTSPASLSGVAVTYNGSPTRPTDAGSYAVVATLTNANYETPDAAGTLVIGKATATLALTAGDLNQTYDGTPRPVGYATTPGGLSGVAVTYDGSSTAPTNAGTYAVVATLTHANYQASNATGALTVAKATATLTLNAGDLLQTYNGSPRVVGHTVSPIGLLGVARTSDGAPTAPTNAGSYAVVASLTHANYQAADASATLVVDKANAVLTLTAAHLSQTYDGTPRTVGFSTNPASLAGVTVSYDGSPTPPTNAGSYAVIASLSHQNYQAPDATGTLVVAKAAATLTLNAADLTQTYDGTPRVVGYATSPVGLTGVAVTYGGSASAPTNAGTYTVEASLTHPNYQASNATGSLVVGKATATLTLNAADLTQTYDGTPRVVGYATSPVGLSGVAVTYGGSASAPTNAGTYTVEASLTHPNYQASNATGSLVVGKATATLTLNAADLTQTYDGTPRVVGYATSPVGLSGVAVTYSGSASAPTNAGTYTVEASLTHPNYQASNATGTLVVGKAMATLTLNAGDLAKTYDGTPKTVGYAIDPAGLATISVTYDGSATAPIDAGSYAVVASLTHQNYQATNATGTLVVGKAAATVTLNAADLNQTFDGTPRSVGYAIDPSSIVGVSVTYDGSPTAPTNAGSYAVVASLTHQNYQSAGATATLVVGKATATLTLHAAALSQTYDGTPRTVGYAVDPATLSSVVVTYDGSTVAPTNAGSYAVVASLTNQNYQAADASGTLEVEKAAATLSVNAADLNQVHNGTPRSVGHSTNPTGLSGVTVTYDGSPTAPSNVGTYAVSISLANQNYTAPPTAASLVVGKATPVVTWSDPAAIVYGTLIGASQLNAIAGVGGNFAYLPAAGALLDAGTRQLSVTFTPTDSLNYSSVSATVNLVVTTAPLTITADNKAMILNAPVPPLTASYAGFVSGQGPGVLDVPVSLITVGTGTIPGEFDIMASAAADRIIRDQLRKGQARGPVFGGDLHWTGRAPGTPAHQCRRLERIQAKEHCAREIQGL